MWIKLFFHIEIWKKKKKQNQIAINRKKMSLALNFDPNHMNKTEAKID